GRYHRAERHGGKRGGLYNDTGDPMACRYIALIADPERGDQSADAAVAATLARLGLRTRFVVGRTTFHLSGDTSARYIEGAGLLIGHLFPKSPASAGAGI